MTAVQSAARKLADWFGEEYVFDAADNLAQRGNYADGRTHYIEAVRVVLQVIREPNDAMIEAGLACGSDRDVVTYWQAMIDAALAEGSDSAGL